MIRLSLQRKADLLTIVTIAFALPAYYKTRFLLEGLITPRDLLNTSAVFEVLFSFLLALLLVAFYRAGGRYLEKIDRRWSQRVFVAALLLLSTLLAIAFTRFFFTYVVPWGTTSSYEFDIALLALLMPLLLSGVADKIFLLGKIREVERAEAAARYEMLKARLSPHFLFNSLNTLVDIIEEDPKLAVPFIEEMSATYRYL